MAKKAQNGEGRRRSRWRFVGWGLAAMLLLIPAVAMQLTDEVNWDAKDFIFAAVLIGTVGILYEAAVRMGGSRAYRAGAAAALAAGFLLVWANGAVGMIGEEDNPYNLLFGGVILIAVAGAVAARCRSAGVALAMIAAGSVHAAVAIGGLAADPRGALFSLGLAGLWLLAAALFRQASREQTPQSAAPIA